MRASTAARLSHPRYHVRFEADSFRDHPGLGWKDADVSALAAMDKLHAVGVATGAKMIDAKHFPGGFRPLTTSAPT